MLELTATNNKDQKHYIVVSTLVPLLADRKDVLEVHIVRTRNIGGTPIRVTRRYPADIGFSECLKKIYVVCELDDELYNLVATHPSSGDE